MKKHMTGLMGAIALFFALGAAASGQNRLWEAEKFVVGSASYSKWGERHGASFPVLGGEYVSQTFKYGIGFRLGMSYYFGDEKALDRGLDIVVPFGVYLPVHITESLAAYAGGGLDLHAGYITNKDESKDSEYRGYGFTENLFAGVRYHFSTSGGASGFVFGEICQDFGEIPVEHEDVVYTNRGRSVYKDKPKVDMSGFRFVVGIGILTW